jgi:hypothetical protein
MAENNFVLLKTQKVTVLKFRTVVYSLANRFELFLYSVFKRRLIKIKHFSLTAIGERNKAKKRKKG